MSYVDDHLNPGEVVVYRSRLHPIVFLTGGLITGLGLLVLASPGTGDGGGILFLIGLLFIAATWLRQSNSEFAVTSSRVVIKVGLLSARSLELQLAKVEALSVNQDLFGQMFNFGTLVVGGTGGTKEVFKLIADPIGFRQAVQQQSEAITRPAPAAPLQAAPARSERECPHCAEMILAKASRCRFCGQPVTPVT